ncbi:hypothetical protein FGO68_gene10600 [Halteria grandinella]|uniref:Uncharacterized protein n=1 Tax=Halteria grandinella TaxID=5974 RepID=A0A8J8NUD3_HALGN|nr:hypothetical protein FGO68_gene10600 [Halteria grandinella]
MNQYNLKMSSLTTQTQLELQGFTTSKKYNFNKLLCSFIDDFRDIFAITKHFNFKHILLIGEAKPHKKGEKVLEGLGVIEVEKLSLLGQSIQEIPKYLKYVRPKKNGTLKLAPEKVGLGYFEEISKILQSFNMQLGRFDLQAYSIIPASLRFLNYNKIAKVQCIKMRRLDNY